MLLFKHQKRNKYITQRNYMTNLIEWIATNKVTGEEVELDVLAVRDGGSFEKVFVKELANFIGCTGNSHSKVIAYLLKSKNAKNQIIGTQRGIAETIGVSLSTVIKVFKALADLDYIKLEHSGVYILNPKVIHYGGTGNKVAILKVWSGLK